jgi:GntR family transcriptional repressor for pyruvate dehydrogenase complex
VENSQDLKESAEMHREIYRAIRSHNPPQAKRSMEEHLNLARMAQAAEANTPQTLTDTPADPAAKLAPTSTGSRAALPQPHGQN